MCAKRADAEWLRFDQNAAGAILGPFDSWLVLRGTKTLPIRMERAQGERRGRSRSSSRGQAKVRKRLLAGLPDHPHTSCAPPDAAGSAP